MLTKSERVGLLLQIARSIEQDHELTRHKIDLMLTNFGMRTGYGSLEANLQTGTDDEVAELAQFLGITGAEDEVPPASHSTTVKTAQPLFVFASHLAAERHFIGAIREELAMYGITLFVAHDSIPDDAGWQHEIEKALDAADAGLVFLHPGFKESDWCPQELGWLLGRHVPVIPLNFGLTPYGPIGKLQASPEKSLDTTQVCEKIIDRLLKQPTLRLGLVASLVKGMQASARFNRTDRIWKYLRELECDANQSAELLSATKTNDQIYRADSPWDQGRPYKRVIIEYLRKQPEVEIIAADVDAYAAYLDEQDAESQRRTEETRRRLDEHLASMNNPGDPF